MNYYDKCPSCENEKDTRSKRCRICSYKIYVPRTGKKQARGWYKHAQLGYIMGSIFGKLVYQHRFLMEQFLKRKLNHNEHVHHIDGNKLNNNLKNLELISAVDHAHEHWPKRPRNKKGQFK